MNITKRKDRLAAMIRVLGDPNIHLVTYNPRDGKTRYAIVSGEKDYFGGRRLATAVGLAEAERMVEAFAEGYRRGFTAAKGD